MGLGPLAGVLAIFVSDIAVLSKLYAEAIENAEKRQAEGVTAAARFPTLIIHTYVIYLSHSIARPRL